jgi:hypothetical protein
MENEQLRKEIIFDRPVRNGKRFETAYSHQGGGKGYASTGTSVTSS